MQLDKLYMRNSYAPNTYKVKLILHTYSPKNTKIFNIS